MSDNDKSLSEQFEYLTTTDHESKESFIARVRQFIPKLRSLESAWERLDASDPWEALCDEIGLPEDRRAFLCATDDAKLRLEIMADAIGGDDAE